MLNGDPKTVLKEKDSGYLDRRPDRQAGRQQQAVLLLQPGVLAAHRRQRRAAFPLPDRGRAGRRLLADARSERRALQLHQGPLDRRSRARAADTRGCFAGRRRPRQDPGVGAVSDRAQHPEAVSAAERQRAPARASTTRSPARRKARSARSRRSASTISPRPSCARRPSTPAGSSGATSFPACSPGSTTRRCSAR